MSNVNEDRTDNIIDVEECAKRGEVPTKGASYRIRINKDTYVVDSETLTGRELLLLAGKTPVEQYMIHQKVKGELKDVQLDEEVDLTAPGVERFITQARDCTEGLSERRDFALPSEDVEFLESLGIRYETVIENNVRRLVLYDVSICLGYTIKVVDLYFRIEAGYPDVQIDMVYFHPALAREDGHTINALSAENFDGRVWQRWSRHRTPQNPWRPGLDNVSTHLAQVHDWLKREFNKGVK